MALNFDGRLLTQSNDKPLTLDELRVLRNNWKHHAVILGLVDSAINRRLSKQVTPV